MSRERFAYFESSDTASPGFLRHRSGQRVSILREITEPDQFHDAEVLPMFVIRFPDGNTYECWPDELRTAEGSPMA